MSIRRGRGYLHTVSQQHSIPRSIFAFLRRSAARIVERLLRPSEWQELTVVRGNRPEYATRLHDMLRRQGIRSVYRVVGTGAGHPAGGIGSVSQNIKLLVHRDDFHRARQVMAQMNRG